MVLIVLIINNVDLHTKYYCPVGLSEQAVNTTSDIIAPYICHLIEILPTAA